MNEIFLGREAVRDGLSLQDLRRWYRPVFRGVYAHKWAKLTLPERAHAAWLSSDRTGIIAGTVASALHGADWVGTAEPIELLVGERRRQSGLVVRMDRVADDEVTTVGELPVTTPARTAFDLGRYQERSTALARLDALMRAAPFRADEVHTLAERYGAVRGVRQLRELLRLVNGGAASPKESWLRLLLIDNGFPTPDTQIPVCDDASDPFAYLDMGWRGTMLAVEYDGEQHRTDRTEYVRDQKRQPRISRQGWEVIRVINEDSPNDVLATVYEAHLRRGGGEIDKMLWATRTFPSNRRFRRNEVRQRDIA
ncbi:MAG TPA: DUF559 domain-containing protein [Mycobacterium sp.]|nr:DUF559 domain-containing protein [Mycobacterium sp.]